MVDIHLAGMLVRFALLDGRQVNIREFDQYRGSTKGRPEGFICPECNEEVVLVLPNQNIEDHFRHLPGSACRSAAGGESAVHLNAKAFLTQQFNKYHRASLVYRCGRCGHRYSYLRIENYDHAEPEWKVGRRRPDIACLRGADVVGAAEIYYTHAVDDEKKGEFNAARLKWFEIGAGQVLTGRYFLNVESADVLAIDAQGAGITYPAPPAICEACEELARKEAFRQHQERLRREQEQREREYQERMRREQEAQRREELYRERERQREELEQKRKQEYEEWKRQEVENARLEAERTAREAAARAEAERLAKEESARREAERAVFEQSGGPAWFDQKGDLHIPIRAIYKYRYWAGGQPLVATLAELGASIEAWRRYAARGPHLLTPRHSEICAGTLQRAGGVIYCPECKYFIEEVEAK